MAHTLIIEDSESLPDFVSRYARFRGVPLVDFMRHTGTRVWRNKGFELAVTRLAKISGNDPRVLAAHSYRFQPSRLLSFLGQTVDPKVMYRKAARYCPHCVIEDVNTYGSNKFARLHCRAAWLNPVLTVCPKHDIAIATSSTAYHNYRCPDFTGALADNWKEVVDAANNAAAVPSTGSDRYFSDRLNGQAVHNEVLDDLPYYGALAICEIVGATELKRPYGGRHHILTAASREPVQHGFEILQSGYSGLRRWLDTIDERGIKWNNNSVGVRLYGPLYSYLKYRVDDPEFAPIVSFVRDHAVRAQKIGPENDFLGQKGFGRFHSTRSAAAQHGIPREIICRKLKAAGVQGEIALGSGVRTLIDVKQMDEFAARLKDSVSKIYVQERLGVSEPTIDRLREAGLLTVTKLTSHPRARSHYSSMQIETLIGRLEELARTSGDRDATVPLSKCAHFMTIAGMIVHALKGDLTLGIKKEGHEATTVLHFVVDPREVARLAPKVIVPDHHYSCFATLNRMAVSADTVRSLGELGVLKALEYTDQGAVHTAYSMASIRTFLLHHISFRRLAGSKSRWETTERRVSGIKPVFDFGGVERIYRKSDLGFN
ncbi:TniQ family protein (plasmid) [Rhizobium sp. CB3171]|uniref:TniQ family protein n=1 Tax=Rhizobium sp. CB3171 TaxID=3039157 RepID=UPI0024B0A1C9|nr:TniQ family protein [Rhizobium sp. CB3171]WFU04689.1 TniQ family protein [Rhizobium sp. CB3171]